MYVYTEFGQGGGVGAVSSEAIPGPHQQAHGQWPVGQRATQRVEQHVGMGPDAGQAEGGQEQFGGHCCVERSQVILTANLPSSWGVRTRRPSSRALATRGRRE